MTPRIPTNKQLIRLLWKDPEFQNFIFYLYYIDLRYAKAVWKEQESFENMNTKIHQSHPVYLLWYFAGS